MPKSIFIIEDDVVYGQSLKAFIQNSFPHIKNVNIFSIGEMSLMELQSNPAIVIVDYFLNSHYPEAHDGLQIIKQIKRHKPATNIIVLSAQKNPDIASNMVKDYGCSYVQKGDNAFQQVQVLMKEFLNKSSSHRLEPWT